jgi:hypothetical protein
MILLQGILCGITYMCIIEFLSADYFWDKLSDLYDKYNKE